MKIFMYIFISHLKRYFVSFSRSSAVFFYNESHFLCFQQLSTRTDVKGMPGTCLAAFGSGRSAKWGSTMSRAKNGGGTMRFDLLWPSSSSSLRQHRQHQQRQQHQQQLQQQQHHHQQQRLRQSEVELA
jgi:hypothetical protein